MVEKETDAEGEVHGASSRRRDGDNSLRRHSLSMKHICDNVIDPYG